MKEFGIKFIDIMFGIVLGLGFQWWPNLSEPWQYIAFIFAYLDIVDYWIDYSPSFRKFPPKREVDLMLDVAIIFSLFLYIYATQLSIIYFVTTFIVFSILDSLWLWRARREYHVAGSEKLFIDTWLRFNIINTLASAGIIGLIFATRSSSLSVLLIFIGFRVLMRVLASIFYKRVYLI